MNDGRKTVPGTNGTFLCPFLCPSLFSMVVFVCLFLGAAFRGYYLLGSGMGIVFGLLAAAVLFLLYGVIAGHRHRSILSTAIVVTVTLAAIFAMAFPSYVNKDLGLLIDDHATERKTQHQLQRILAGEAKFANLDIQCKFTKCIIVTVHGTLRTKSDLFELRRRIFENCPKVASRWLFWDITVLDSGIKYDDIDLTLFGEVKETKKGIGEKEESPIIDTTGSLFRPLPP